MFREKMHVIFIFKTKIRRQKYKTVIATLIYYIKKLFFTNIYTAEYATNSKT